MGYELFSTTRRTARDRGDETPDTHTAPARGAAQPRRPQRTSDTGRPRRGRFASLFAFGGSDDGSDNARARICARALRFLSCRVCCAVTCIRSRAARRPPRAPRRTVSHSLKKVAVGRGFTSPTRDTDHSPVECSPRQWRPGRTYEFKLKFSWLFYTFDSTDLSRVMDPTPTLQRVPAYPQRANCKVRKCVPDER